MIIKRIRSKIAPKKKGPAAPKSGRWDFELYVAGSNSKTLATLNNLKQICRIQLKGKYHIKVIDLLKHPRSAREHQIVAIPTVIRSAPLPVKNIIGDLSNTEHLLSGLGLLTPRAIQRF